MYHDPEAIYQDADIEMLELAEAADSNVDPWKQCEWCPGGNQDAVARIDILVGGSTKTLLFCEQHRQTARDEKVHYEEMRR